MHLSQKIQLATLIVFALSCIAASQTEQIGTFSTSSTTTTICAPPTYGCAQLGCRAGRDQLVNSPETQACAKHWHASLSLDPVLG